MNIYILSQKFCDYAKYIKGYTDDTIRNYQGTINTFCKFAKVQEIEEVNSNIVRSFFYQGRTDRQWSSSSFITYHKALIVFFRWCLKENYLLTNPIEDIEVPKLEKKLPSRLTRQDAIKILEIIYNYPYDYRFLRYRNHAIFSTFILAGLRKKELLKLKFMDVDLDNYSIYVRKGKGSKDRIVPVCHKLAESLQKYLIERKRLKKTCPEFFASLNHDMGFTDHGLKHLVDKVREITGLNFSIHKLRHTFATLMLEGGCDIFSLSKMLGHNDMKTTAIYLAASAEHLRSQIIKHPLNNI